MPKVTLYTRNIIDCLSKEGFLPVQILFIFLHLLDVLMFRISQIKDILTVSFVLFSSFARALRDRYDSQMVQDVFQNLEAKILENDIIVVIIAGLFDGLIVLIAHIFLNVNTLPLAWGKMCGKNYTGVV